MNNPYNLKPHKRAIAPTHDFGKGINWQMSKERRAAKQARHRRNKAERK